MPAFGDWDQKQDGVPDYSIDFSKIREMRRQNKKDLSRLSVGNDDELINPTAAAVGADHHVVGGAARPPPPAPGAAARLPRPHQHRSPSGSPTVSCSHLHLPPSLTLPSCPSPRLVVLAVASTPSPPAGPHAVPPPCRVRSKVTAVSIRNRSPTPTTYDDGTLNAHPPHRESHSRGFLSINPSGIRQLHKTLGIISIGRIFPESAIFFT